MYTKNENCDYDALWQEYKKEKSTANRNKIICEYSFLVSTIAARMKNICFGTTDMEDLISQGFLALIDAVERFDTEKEVKFETFASIRVRGAMIDYVRKQDLIPRRIRKNAKTIEEISQQFWIANNRQPTEIELAALMKISVEKLRQYQLEVLNTNIVYFDSFLTGQETMLDTEDNSGFMQYSPENEVINKEIHSILTNAIDSLSEQEKMVITLYYYEKLKLKDIAYVYDLTPSRVCQIHTKAIEKIKKFMKDKEIEG